MAKRREKARDKAELQKLLDELWSVEHRLSESYTEFNNVLEPDLIEASVYQINSLQARYSYILRKIKGFGDIKIEDLNYPKEELPYNRAYPEQAKLTAKR